METYKEGVQAGETFYEQTTVVDGGFNIAYNNNNNNNNHSIVATTTTPAPSSRWNPTPEQLLALKEIYQQGIRTPSANQIQQIAVELLRFGKIEGKNVFYWFQNHKARERQKRRREGESNNKLQKQEADMRESGIRKSAHHDQLQHSKNLVASSNCQTNTEGLVPIQWQQEFQKRELELQQQEKENTKKNQLSQTARNDAWQNGFFPSAKFLELHQEQCSYLSDCTTLENEAREIQTLQLFPLRNINDDYEGVIKTDKRDKELAVTAINTKSSPGQFFEFLPLKN